MKIFRNTKNDFTVFLTEEEIIDLAAGLWLAASPEDQKLETMREKLEKAVYLDAGEVI